MPWDAIKLVTSGLTLAAFAAALIAWIIKSKSEERERLIGQASENKRADLVRDALEFFRIDTSGLTKEQQYQLALEQIRARAQRFKLVAMVVCVMALLGGAVAVYAITHGSGSTGGLVDQPHEEKATVISKPRIPEFRARRVYPTNAIERTEFETDPGRFPREKLNEFLTLSRLAFGTADETNGAFQVNFTIKNITKEAVLLDLNQRYFTMVDNKGRAAELIYFCCESKGGTLAPGEEQIVELMFKDAGWYGKSAAASAIFVRVQGFLPVVSASWKTHTLAMAN